MPEVVSIGSGGGSKVYVDPQNETVTVGPASVGQHIQQEAKFFGGETLTSSDIIVALGKAQLGDPTLVKDVLSPILLEKARKQLKSMLEDIIGQMKVSDALCMSCSLEVAPCLSPRILMELTNASSPFIKVRRMRWAQPLPRSLARLMLSRFLAADRRRRSSIQSAKRPLTWLCRDELHERVFKLWKSIRRLCNT
jgi:N-methylhydantoinase A/oxoprolinase/acetone carboxylase beta subunit